MDITDQLTETGQQATLVGQPGLRQMVYRSRRSSDVVRFTAGDDLKRLACKATVTDIGSALVIATLLVHRQFPLSHFPLSIGLLPASSGRCGVPRTHSTTLTPTPTHPTRLYILTSDTRDFLKLFL